MAAPDRLYFTDSDEANALIASDPMALLIGFALDQQVSVQKAFSGPLALRSDWARSTPRALAAADLEPLFREQPAIHRFPGSMAQRVHELAVTSATTTTGTPRGCGPTPPTPISCGPTSRRCPASAR